MKKIVLLFFIALNWPYNTQAQNIWNKLKQKAEQIGEKVIDKTVDDLVNGKPPKSDPAEAAGTKIPVPAPIPPGTNTGASVESKAPAPVDNMIHTDTLFSGADTIYRFNTSTITAKEFVSYALTLKGTPYSYGSTDPAFGLDCSGFITHVFNHFNIQVPRRSFDFKNSEKKVKATEAKPGDLILFTGSDDFSKTPGHMGIVISKPGQPLEFLHASSGKANSVTTTFVTNPYYKTRVLEFVRVFQK